MSEPKRYRIVINIFWETELRSTDECIEEGEEEESQEYVCLEDYARLKSEVERLTKAGDAMAQDLLKEFDRKEMLKDESYQNWLLAKQGKTNE
jgi:hypothetical protein